MNKNKENKYTTANKQGNINFSIYISSFSWTNLKKFWLIGICES